MLQLVLGRSGTGKTTHILQAAADSVNDGNRVLLLVPEQFSFATERAMLHKLGGRALLNISVLSFSRLAENIFRSYGGLAAKRLNDTSRLVLMRLAVNECADMLEVYGRQSRRTDFLTAMLQTVDELKSGGAYPQQLRQTINALHPGALRSKLTDITSIYEVYQGIIERGYQDPLDDIARAVRLVRGTTFFSGCHIYIDGFSFFSPPERELIDIMMEQAERLTVSLTADGLSEQDADIFHDQKQTAHRLINHAAKAGLSTAKPIIMSKNKRAQLPALLAVEQLAAVGDKDYDGSAQGVRVLRARDKYDEVRAAAAELTRLVRRDGLRYRDAAVVCRNLEDYQTALESIFLAYGIPVFFDKREPVASRPIIAVTLAALDAVRAGWNTEAILRVARCPAAGLEQEQTAALENYLYIWSISGKDWDKPFTGSPSGLEHPPTEQDSERLGNLEQLRHRLIEPLTKLRDGLRGCTGGGFAVAVYSYLCDIDAVANLRRSAEACAEDNLEQADALYNALIDILDLFGDVMCDVGLPTSTFIEMFELAAGCIELGSIPNTNDQTVVGSADRIRLDSPRVVFVLGVNEGVFPARYRPHGMFSDNERALLCQSGVEISTSPFQRALLERFFLYSALSAPSWRLYVSYCERSLDGTPQEPSLIIEQLAELLPQAFCTVDELPEGLWINDLFTAREQYVRSIAAGKPSAALHAALLLEGDERFLSTVEGLGQANPAQGISRDTARQMLQGRIKLSPSRIEEFYRCPYLYFCNSMLKLRPRRRVEYTPLESGLALHYVLEQLLLEYDGRALGYLSEEERRQRIAELLRQYLESVSGDTEALKNRFKYQFDRLVTVLELIVRHIGEEFAQSSFVPVGVEVKVGDGGSVKPLSFTTKDGLEITVNGKIDRVDLYFDGKERYARVVDYKSGGKEFSLDEVFYGLNMQMLIYLFALCEDKNSTFGEVRPAGILYMPGRVSPANLLPGDGNKLLRELIDDTLQMKGLLLEDEKILRAMERELSGRYIPAKAKSGGELTKGSKVKSAAEFARLRDTVCGNIAAMGDALAGGDVQPLPARSSRVNPCDTCDYGLLCANRNTPLFRAIGKAAQTEKEVGNG